MYGLTITVIMDFEISLEGDFENLCSFMIASIEIVIENSNMEFIKTGGC